MLVWPILKGTFERHTGLKPGGPARNPPARHREHVVTWIKDIGRTPDYLETRPDVDSSRAAFYDWSIGAGIAPLVLGVERRFKAAFLLSGGLFPFRHPYPEVDPLHFAPRVRTPVLMLNGRHDVGFPLETSQLPLFRLLGTPAAHKKHVVTDGGHHPPEHVVIREYLDWFDRYLGPVNRLLLLSVNLSESENNSPSDLL